MRKFKYVGTEEDADIFDSYPKPTSGNHYPENVNISGKTVLYWATHEVEDIREEWEEVFDVNHVIDINTILHTKDGSKVGNAIIIGREGYFWKVKTDYGNEMTFTSEQIELLFNVAWVNLKKEIDGVDCNEMQKMMLTTHKYRVE